MSPESKSQQSRPARRAGRVGATLLAIPIVAAISIAFATSAAAAIPFCPPGTGPGQCEKPKGVATDRETGRVYVVDQGNHRIDVFESDGTFLFSFGSAHLTEPTSIAVDNDEASTSHHDVYVSADNFEVQKFAPSGEFVESFGGKGQGACKLMSLQETAEDPVAVGPGGEVVVADSYDKDGEGPLQVFVNRIQRFDPEGKCLGEVVLSEGVFEGTGQILRALAVDSAGDFYVSVRGSIRKYSPSGVFLSELSGVETEALAIDPAGNVFAKQRGDTAASPARITYFIAEYAPDGSLARRFAYNLNIGNVELAISGLAAFVDEGGAEGIFASEGSKVPGQGPPTRVNLLQIPKGPVVLPEPCHVKNGEPGSVRATVKAEINPEGKATSVRVEYSDGSETKTSPPEALGGPADFELHEALVTLEGLTPETTYHCRVIAENAEGATPPGEEGSFETKEGFEFGSTFVTEAGEEEVTLTAEGNPLGLPAKAQIEYVTDAKFEENESRFAEAQTAPAELDYGAGETMQARSATLTGLSPATTYHWRLHVKNGVPPQGIVCPRNKPEPCPANEHLFRTYGADEKADERGWELVSPAQKNGAEVATPKTASGIFEDRNVRIQASSGSGEAATYTSFTSFGKEAKGAPATSQYLSKRTPGGWTTEDISPFGFQLPILAIPFKGFTAELNFGAFKVSDGSFTADCPVGFENLYLRNSTTGSLQCLTPEVPEEGDIGCFVYAGSSEDGSRAFFASGARYAGVPAGKGFSLYEWSAEGGLRPVSVLPGQSAPAAPTEGTAFGQSLARFSPSNCQFGQSVMRHVVSADGSKAFWTYWPEAEATVVAVEPGVQTLTVSNAEGGTFGLTFKGERGSLAFNASAAAIQEALESLSSIGAGNVAVSGSGPYTIAFKGTLAGTNEQLSADSSSLSANTQLLARVNGSETIQLDAKSKTKPGAGPSGNGVFGAASKDGSVVYFTDTGKLTSNSKADPKKPGEPGKADLYRYEFGKAEPLSDLTKGAVPGDVQGVIGASEDGSYLYFVAKAALSGEEEGPTGQKALEGAPNLYLYHGGKTSFIARLSAEDRDDWLSQPKYLGARVTPDGRHLAFLSLEAQALAGYDNTVAEGVHCQWSQVVKELRNSPLCAQGFLYDADANTLSCATCNPTGARPLGPTVLPGWSNPYEGPRYLSEDGSRFFFESFDALLKADENEKRDVYEFERPGTGSCTSESSSFDPASGGCHFLVSSGKSSDESYLVDASSNGRDVFFSTRQALVGWDPNEDYDVYDHREGGGFPEPVEPNICLGESCKGPAGAAPPGSGSAATPGFVGPGNAKPHKPKPGRHKKKHRKAKKKPHSHKKGARR